MFYKTWHFHENHLPHDSHEVLSVIFFSEKKNKKIKASQA